MILCVISRKTLTLGLNCLKAMFTNIKHEVHKFKNLHF